MKESDSSVYTGRVSARIWAGSWASRRGREGFVGAWGLVRHTQVLKVMEDGLTPKLLSCSSSWNLMGKAGAMVVVMRSAARGLG